MVFKIDQNELIDNLNKYLEWHNLPIRMNRAGVCNGLATVYAKYVLEGKQEDFKTILTQIAKMILVERNQEDELNQFATDVALTFRPNDYNRQLTSLQSINLLKIGEEELKSAFTFAVTTNDQNWTKILKEIELDKDEAMIVRSCNHAVAISKKEDHYVIYDPNYSSGFKTFKNEKEVIQELHFNVFKYTGELGVFTDFFDISEQLSPIAVPLELFGPLSMQIDVIRHPYSSQNKPRTFPDVGELYKQYLEKNEVAMASGGNVGVSNVHWAIMMNNPAALETLYEKGFKHKDPVAAARIAAALNATEVLPMILSKINPPPSDLEINQIFIAALSSGRKEALDFLLRKDPYKQCYEIFQRGNAAFYISQAALGGNPDILQEMINNYGSMQTCKAILEQTGQDKDPIYRAIESRSTNCVKLLYAELKKSSVFFSQIGEKQLLSHLLQAVKSNQPHMVKFFTNEIKTILDEKKQNHLFNSIHMSTTRCDKTDLYILRKLKKKGVHFSEAAQAVINLKEERPVGFLLSIGIMLYKFTDFIKEHLLKKDEIEQNIKNFQGLKNMSVDVANEKEELPEPKDLIKSSF